MNDKDVDKQIKQMVDFILQEAKEKSQEIMVKATEEFNIEKLRLLEQEKVKIRQEYERKEKAVEIQKKIACSNEVNQSRLKILAARDHVLTDVKKIVSARLVQISHQPQEYRNLLRQLIVQALFRLEESSVVVRCREVDVQVVQSLFDEAAADYERGVHQKVTLTLSRQFLPPPTDSVPEGAPSCAGGVVVQTTDGKIVCDNTLDARENIVFQQKLPEIKKGLFGASASRTHID